MISVNTSPHRSGQGKTTKAYPEDYLGEVFNSRFFQIIYGKPLIRKTALKSRRPLLYPGEPKKALPHPPCGSKSAPRVAEEAYRA